MIDKPNLAFCRKSSGFARGVSKYRGVARYKIKLITSNFFMKFLGKFSKYNDGDKCRHHHNGRWEARIGRVSGNKYLYLGTYSE